MAQKKRKTPGINGSSTADISFILLLFFLLTTSMGSDKGISRQLPPAVPKDQQQETTLEVNRRNILKVLVNNAGQVLANGEFIPMELLKDRVKEFVLNENDAPNLPERTVESFPLLGEQKVTKKHVISLTNNVDTRYEDYIAVQNILTAAYTELRDEKARKEFGSPFENLTTEQKDALIKMFPQKISEAEPRDYSKK